MPPVGRGGLKLEAAFDLFPLNVKGARAVDVGASTGGFTEALLAHGAAHVTAVDVGKGQLHSKLASDPRVTNLEGVDWKKLSLDVAPGPFDFFSVDVSFVAARSMLRGLAFRLRPGAEGVILVKPQFELPDQKVKGGIVIDENLRRLALQRVREKGEPLGFELVEFNDSPVAGGSGTVEILAHFRFRGRTEKLPQPGERRRVEGQVRQSAARQIAARDYFAVAAPGLEPYLAKELSALGIENRIVPGGVEFSGPLETMWRANLWLRTATRILLRIGELEAREFGKLRHRSGTLPWKSFLPPHATVEISASASRCRLYHTGAVAENLEHAIADAVGKPEAGEPFKVLARGVGDRWTLSLDTSGELLHKRGWRSENAEAPLRETLAAALLMACEWDPSTALYDPMCGAGTIVAEGCAMAMELAPGLGRAFAFERWSGFDAARFTAIKEEARAKSHAPAAPIAGSDHSPSVIAAARRNLERAGLATKVRVEAADLDRAQPPAPSGLVLTNAPYGKRVGDPRALRPLYVNLGRLLRERFRGWRAAVLLQDSRLISALGKPRQVTPFINGGLRVQLVQL